MPFHPKEAMVVPAALRGMFMELQATQQMAARMVLTEVRQAIKPAAQGRVLLPANLAKAPENSTLEEAVAEAVAAMLAGQVDLAVAEMEVMATEGQAQ